MARFIGDKKPVTSMTDEDRIAGVFGGTFTTAKISDFIKHIKGEDELLLQQIAWYLEVNVASNKGAKYVNYGGNMHMRAVYESLRKDVLMDKNGNYCVINPNDARYTEDGEAIINLDTGVILDKWKNCDIMGIIPERYEYVQSVTVAGVTKHRLWISPLPIPNGTKKERMVVGKFKASLVDDAMRSLPGQVPASTKTINAFWDTAQVRSKNHGLANLDFRTYLLEYMMSKYGQRDSQNCVTEDGTLVWGCGLDGTESTNSDKFAAQKTIKTGHTLSLGLNDGKVAVADNFGVTCHGVNVNGFENPWGQYWEMVQGLCSVGADVYCWDSNWLPTDTPASSSFVNVNHVRLKRHTTEANIFYKFNILSDGDKQGLYPVPMEAAAGIDYGDHYWYASNGQLWLWGGSSFHGAQCGLAASGSGDGWSDSHARVSARLAYYGDITKVSSRKLAELTA